MLLIRYLSATLAESLVSLSGIPSGLVALFAFSDLTILFISSLEAGGKSKLKQPRKGFSFTVTILGWLFLRFNCFFYCSSILTLGIKVTYWGGLISRRDLCNIYIVVIKNILFGSFLRTPFSAGVMLPLVMIPLLVRKGLIVFQNDFLPFFAITFRKYGFLAHLVKRLHFFHFYKPRSFS